MSARVARILVVEDEPAIREGLVDNLRMEGHEVLAAADGKAGLALALESAPDLVILDLMLPRMDGHDVLRRIRQERLPTMVICLTARGTEADKVRGLASGADDYVTKPFGVLELLARVKAVLRRRAPQPDPLPELRLGAFHADFLRMEARRGETPLPFTHMEFKLLRYLATHPGRVIPREELLDKVWGHDHLPTTRTVDNHIVKLRKAVEKDPANPERIVSVRGAGYKFVPDPA
ncbi:MAG: response regulator transcription factor [Planctomycetes bacterium]|nr:response regulator transcription factor [Planctomycetota bacterium]